MTAPLARVPQAALNPPQLARKAIRDPALIPDIIEGLNADKARVKYGCAKTLRIVGEERPDLLYPHFDFFVRLLDHENKIFQWEASFVLSLLARVDTEDKITDIFDKYFSPIPGPVMITAANVIQGGARIGRTKPQLADRVAAEVLKVAKARYQTAECRNVAIGHGILALGEVLPLLSDWVPAVQFVKRQLKNSRAATRKKAEQFLKSNLGALAAPG